MIDILTWISIITGGILILLLILSVLGGLDLDLDLGDTEIEADGGGLGILKGALTFVSVGSWVIKIMMTMEHHPGLAILVGVLVGGLAFWLLNYLLRVLLRNEENVNWKFSDAMMENGEVYLKIPAEGTGLVYVEVNGARRELKARSSDGKEIPTGTDIIVVDIDGEVAIVREQN